MGAREEILLVLDENLTDEEIWDTYKDNIKE
jgi:hypothetical protein